MDKKQSSEKIGRKTSPDVVGAPHGERSVAPVGRGPTHTQITLATIDPRRLLPADVLTMQRTLGNHAVVQLLDRNGASTWRYSPLEQPTRTTGPGRDADEIEANRIAGQVVRAPTPPAIQPKRDKENTTIQPAPTFQQGSTVVQRKSKDIKPPTDQGHGMLFRSTMKKINSKIAAYNALVAGSDKLKVLVKEQKILNEAMALIERWMNKHVTDTNLDASTDRKKRDLERVYAELESELYLVQDAIVTEKDLEAGRTGKMFKEAGVPFKDNWNSERGDVIYGISRPRQVYINTAKQKTPSSYWFTMDDYNNFFGIGTGAAFVEANKVTAGGLTAKKDKLTAHMDAQLGSVANDTTGERVKAYHKNLKGSKFDPTTTLEKDEQQLSNNAASWAKGSNKLLNLQWVKGVRQACKFGLELVATREPFVSQGAVVHFVLDGLGDLANIANKQTTSSAAGTYLAITSSELRFVYRNWDRLKHAIKFYINAKEVSAPWEGGWTVRAKKSGEILSGKLAWREYGRRSRMKASQIATPPTRARSPHVV